jgi:hypothetical protein
VDQITPAPPLVGAVRAKSKFARSGPQQGELVVSTAENAYGHRIEVNPEAGRWREGLRVGQFNAAIYRPGLDIGD